MTVRQVYYRLVCAGVIDKTEAEYKTTVVRLLGEMRREGVIPFSWIADNTRWMRAPRTYSGLTAMLDECCRTYRRALWNDQNAYVEVWLEKEALAGVLYPETERWAVPLMVTRGYPSLSFLAAAAEAIRAQRKTTYLYYFGDHDPSGTDISRVVEAGVREMTESANITFERVAVTPKQIRDFALPTRPTKKSDTRSGSFEGESVEVDALQPAVLRTLARERIERHIDPVLLQRTLAIEDQERETLRSIQFIGEPQWENHERGDGCDVPGGPS